MVPMSPTAGESDATWPADAVEVARVVDAFGIRGEIKLAPHAAMPQALLAARHWWARPPEGPAPAGMTPPKPGLALAGPARLRVRSARTHGDTVVASIEGICDRDAALALRGVCVFVPRSAFPKTAAGEYYWTDLIGLAAINRDGVNLGEVVGLLDTGPHCVLRLRPPAGVVVEGGERLIPFVAAFVGEVDLAARRVDVDWGEDY